ncbi:MAG: hypothetical protein AAFY71_14430 [Bacteroidota bacterium]
MQLEELKTWWQEHESGQMDSEEIDRKMLHQVIRSRSKSALASIKRNIWLEIFLLVLPLWAMWTYVLWKEASIDVFFWAVGILTLVNISFYGIKLFRINHTPLMDPNIKQSLEKLVWTLGTYMKMYMFVGVILVPLGSAIAVYWGFFHAAAGDGKGFSDIEPWILLLLLGVMLLYGISSWLFFRWYVNKLYGQHYRELTNCLKELDVQPSA